jgi:hypothetical protein
VKVAVISSGRNRPETVPRRRLISSGARCGRSFLKPKRRLQSRRLSAAITSNKALEDINASLSGCSECGTTSVGANPLYHGTEAIRALRREMFAQTHAFEQFDGIGVQDLSCAFA